MWLVGTLPVSLSRSPVVSKKKKEKMDCVIKFSRRQSRFRVSSCNTASHLLAFISQVGRIDNKKIKTAHKYFKFRNSRFVEDVVQCVKVNVVVFLLKV